MEGTSAAIRVETSLQDTPLPAGQDPNEIRWGINTTVRDKIIDVERAGFAWLPFGKFFPVLTFSTTEAIHTIDDNPNLPREHRVSRTASSAQMYIDSMIGGKTENGHPDPQRTNWGVQFAFFGEKDSAKMAVIDSVLLPKLSDISKKCPSTDPLEDRETCPTCWLEYLNSEDSFQRMRDVSENGVLVQVFDRISGQTTDRTVKPQFAELVEAKAIVTAALTTGIGAARALWSTVAIEIREKQRRSADKYQDNIRKDVHADRPDEENLAQIRELAKVQNQPASNGDGGAVMERVVSILDRMDQRLAKLEGPAETVAAPVAKSAEDFPMNAAVSVPGVQEGHDRRLGTIVKKPFGKIQVQLDSEGTTEIFEKADVTVL